MASEAQRRDYEIARARYQAALVDYQARLAHWNSLSNAEKNAAHQAAERGSLLTWSLGLSFIVSWIFYRFLLVPLRGDIFWIVWAVVTIAVTAGLVSIASAVGRLIRGLFFSGVLSCVVAVMFASIHFKHPPSSRLITTVIVLTGFCTFLYELSGGFHANARPKPPRPPRLIG